MVAIRDLEVRHLQALDAVADAGTFGRAAERLGYTQSAISQQIAALERVLGEPVFDRPGGPRPVELTPLGELLVTHARAVLGRLDEATNDLERFRAGTIGRVDIGTFQSVSTAILPAILGRLRDDRPDLDVRLVEDDDHDELVRLVLDGQVDVSFLLHEVAGTETVELFTDPFVVIAARGELDAGPVAPARLHGAALIAEPDNPCQRQIDDGLHALGVEPKVVYRTHDNSAIAAMVRAHMGIAVMPLLALDPDDERLVVRPLEPPLAPRRILLGWRAGRAPSPAARCFVEVARQVTAAVRERNRLDPVGAR